MNKYHDRSDLIAALVEPDRVHRDVYLNEELFALEQQRLFGRSWVFVGHGSQVPHPGDYVTSEIAGTPVVLVRQADGSPRVLTNRCAHKGAMIVSAPSGNVGRAFRCPYHSWSYRLDGSLLAVPMREGYEGTRMRECETGAGLHRIASAEHRGFVFARLAEDGPSLQDYFGTVLSCIDAMADRSPLGELEVAGACLRNIIRCNWKIYLENINDAVHANVTHEAAASAAETVWSARSPEAARPMVIEQLAPFASGNDFMEKMGGRVFANGHSILGVNVSIHSDYSAISEYAAYEAAMHAAYGVERAKRVLSWSPQNAMLYPSIAIKAAPQTMRVIRPLGPARTLVETWTFRLKGAPEALLERTQLYNRLVFSPMSIVAHDDVHVFESIQRALRACGNEWVSLHRGFDAAELGATDLTVGGTNEVLMRNQYRAWVKALTQ